MGDYNLSKYSVHKIFQPSLEIENSSNQQLSQVLEGKLLDENILNDEKFSNTDQDLVYQQLYGEVIEEDNLESGVRLKASVLYQLFKDTNYNLKDVRINKWSLMFYFVLNWATMFF